MIRDAQFVILPEEAGKRLDAVVRARFPATTATLAQRAIIAGDVRIEGRGAHKGVKVEAGARVAIARLQEAGDLRVAPNPVLPLEILYADADLVAANKPAGMAVHPLLPEETDTLANALAARYPELAAVGDHPLAGGIAHRIDGGTSGVVLAARHARAFEALRAQFAGRSVRKAYVALVAGAVSEGGELAHDLVHQPWRRGRMVDARRLKNPDRPMRAVTAYRPVRRVGGFTLLDVTIFTGVTHQIRCQLALAGHPIVGDTLYGGPVVPGFDRHFLHAAAIDLAHPCSGAPLRIAAALTGDLRALLANLDE